MAKIIIVLLIIAAVANSSPTQEERKGIGQVVSRIRHEEKLSRHRLATANNEIDDIQKEPRLNLLKDAEKLLEAIEAVEECNNFADSVQTAIGFFITHERLYERCAWEEKFVEIDDLMAKFGDYLMEAKNCAATCDEATIMDLLDRVVMLSSDLEVKIGATSELVKKCSRTVAQEMANLLTYLKQYWQECLAKED